MFYKKSAFIRILSRQGTKITKDAKVANEKYLWHNECNDAGVWMKHNSLLCGIIALIAAVGLMMTACEGPMGPQGIQGMQGEQGDTGDTGAEGPQGPEGPKGDTGDTGDTGAEGPEGPEGPKGDTGNDGDDAPSGSFVVFFHRNNTTAGSIDAYPMIIMVPASPGATVEQLPQPPIRAGYVFHNWNTRANGSGAVFSESTVITANITVYAQWLHDIALAEIVVTSSHTYTGAAQEAAFTVTHNGDALVDGTDFTVSYTDNTNAGADTALITITGVAENGYGGTATAPFTIEPKLLAIVDVTAVDREYDGTTAAALTGTPALEGLIAGDIVTLNPGAAAFADKNAGTDKAIVLSDWELAGEDADNYTLVYAITADITPRPVTVTGVSATNREYDGSVNVILSGGELEGIITDDVVIMIRGSGRMADAHAGEDKPVTTAIMLVATDADNYTLIQPDDVTVTITKKPITAAGTPLSKVYDGTASATPGAVIFTGLIAGDTLVVDVDYEITHAGFIGGISANAGTNKMYLYVIGMLDTPTANDYHLSSGSVTGSGGVIYKADPVVTWPTGLTAAYGQTLAHIALPGNGTSDPAGTFAWATPAALVGSLGAQSYNMIFTPVDATNYNTATQDVELTIHKADPEVTWPTNLTAIFGQALSDIALPGNGTASVSGSFAWATPTASVGNAGAQSYNMTFTPTDATNYNTMTQGVSVTVHYLVSFITNGGSSIPAQSIIAGDTVTRPPNPSRSGYVFDHWYQNAAFTVPYNFTAAVPGNANITLYAKWVSQTDIDAMNTKNMVWIPGGTFQMGSPSTETGRNAREDYRTENDGNVTVSGFYMGRYQVTQEQYQAVMGNNPSAHRAGGSRASFVTGLNTNTFPVETVSWYDAIVFCNRLSILEGLTPAYRIPGYGNSDDPEFWIASNGGTIPGSSNTTWNAVEIVPGSTGYRLPTEAQWEYACRAGTTTAYNTGATINTSQANYNSVLNRTSAVGSYAPNVFGLYDMHGNVWEWCWDWYNASYNNAGGNVDPLGASSGTYRVIRGGGWNFVGRNLRSADRNGSYNPGHRYDFIGFRLLRP